MRPHFRRRSGLAWGKRPARRWQTRGWASAKISLGESALVYGMMVTKENCECHSNRGSRRTTPAIYVAAKKKLRSDARLFGIPVLTGIDDFKIVASLDPLRVPV